MKVVLVERFGGPEVLKIMEVPTPEPGPGQVRVRVTSIGLNHAELMARRGEYRLSSGEPPFIPGIEAGGIIDAIGEDVTARHIGQRVLLGSDAPRRTKDTPGGLDSPGTYRTEYVTDAEKTVPAPAQIPDEQLGAIWLPFLTAWGCLIWKQRLQSGAFVAIPAASSAVALAASQIAKQAGAITIGMTTSAGKIAKLREMPEAEYDHVILTRDEHHRSTHWHGQIKQITDGHGVDVFFDPVAAGTFLDTEVRTLAQYGTIWVYGLLGKPGKVDVSPLIRKRAAIRGWVLGELSTAGPDELQRGYAEVLLGFEQGVYAQRVARVFRFDEVQTAHEEMERGEHIGKLVMVP